MAHLDFALGGTIVMDGFPVPPLSHMAGESLKDARSNATYYGNDMNWFIWHAEDDQVFPVNLTMTLFDEMFEALEIKDDVLNYRHIEPKAYHMLYEQEFEDMVKFIRGDKSESYITYEEGFMQ